MKLTAANVFTVIEGPVTDWVLKEIDDISSFKIHGRWFSKHFRKGNWDGVRRFRKARGGRQIIPTGFLECITKRLDEINCTYELYDERDLESPEPIYELNGARLDQGKWDFQADALNAALVRGRGVIKIATGGGKSEVGAAIIKSYGLKTLWLTHRQSLLYQTHERLEERLGEKIGLIGDGHYDPKKITVAMVQTLGRKKPSKGEDHQKFRAFRKKADAFMETLELCCLDEVHHLESSLWYSTISKIPAAYRFGLTATPCFDGAGMHIIAQTGDIIAEVSSPDLIERGVLVQPRIWFLKIDDPILPKSAAWPTVYSQGVVHNEHRNTLLCSVAWTYKREEKTALTLVKRINHGKILRDLFRENDLRVEFIQGAVSVQDRKVILEQLRTHKLDHVIAVAEILGEGVDLPWLEVVVNACGTRGGGSQSNSMEHETGRGTLQILGRILRAAPGKTSCEYVDVGDRTHKFLTKAALERAKTLEEAGYGPWIRRWKDRQVAVA